uniref:AIP3 domain-containing protein n=1 Tax=Rhabditophanes sp. KR3021 TaxID=114890 RepID=A0AC35TNF0_9BILA
MRSTNSMKYASNSPLPNPRDIHHSFSIPRNHFNQPTPILLNGNNSEVHQHISRTGTLPRKVYKQSEFDRHDKKKRASFSLPSSPKVAQAPGMRRLENWIGGLINNGKEPIPPNNINGPNVNVVPSNYSNVNNSHWDYTNVQIEKNEPEKQSYTHIGSLPRNFTGNRNVPVSVPSTPQHRANKLLQQLRSDEGNVSESDDQLNGDHHQRLMPTNKPLPPLYPRSNAPNQGIYSGLSMSGVIFLQFNDETKRTLLPHKLSSMDQLKEIKDRCIIKIREQISGYQSPPPIRFTDRAPAVDYMSEGEVDDYPGFTRTGFPKQINTQIRPASAVPGTDGRMYSAGNNTPTNRRDSGSKFDPYYDPYFSDSSSIVGGSQQVPRSATATPVVDREARFRMESMEKQLHGLSSLVHQALVSKNVEGGGQKDMADLRRQILEFNNDNIDMLSTTGSIDQRNFDNCNGSVCSSVGVNENLVGDLKKIRKQIQTYNVDMKHLKKQAQDLKTTNSDSMRYLKTLLIKWKNILKARRNVLFNGKHLFNEKLTN